MSSFTENCCTPTGGESSSSTWTGGDRTLTLARALRDLSALPPTSQRAITAIIGAIVADAATRPFHWVYDQSVIDEALSTEPSLDFWPVSMSPFYTLPTGRRSCYSEESVCMLKSLPSSPEAKFSREDYSEELHTRFSLQSDYAQALRVRKIKYDGSQRLTHREPVEGPWQHQCLTTFLATGEGDRTINESDGFSGSIPLIAWLSARLGGKQPQNEDNEQCVERKGDRQEGGSLMLGDEKAELEGCIGMLTATEVSMQHSLCMARILQRVIIADKEHSDNNLTFIVKTVQSEYAGQNTIDINAEIQAVFEITDAGETYGQSDSGCSDQKRSKFVATVAKFGKACSFPGSFQSSLLAILAFNSYSEAVRENIAAGGCNCSRANMIGCVLGAEWGIGEEKGGIPEQWILQTDIGVEMLVLAIDKFRLLLPL